jgi:hypothetical protein
MVNPHPNVSPGSTPAIVDNRLRLEPSFGHPFYLHRRQGGKLHGQNDRGDQSEAGQANYLNADRPGGQRKRSHGERVTRVL